MRVALSALAMTEYFRDEKNQDVLLFIDNIFRFSQARLRVRVRRCVSAVRRPRSVTSFDALQRDGASSRSAHHLDEEGLHHLLCRPPCTSPQDDLMPDPAPANTFAHLDSTIVLERSIAELGIYPAVDPLASRFEAFPGRHRR